MPDVDPDAPERVLLVRLSHLGDVVHALPAFWALRRRWPAAEIGWVVQPEFAPLLWGLPGLDRCFLFDRRGGARAWWRLARDFRGWRPDLSLDVQGNAKSAAVGLASRARRRLGLHPTEWREPLAARLANAWAPPTAGRHAVDRVLNLAAWATGRPSTPADFDLGLTDAERGRGRARLERGLGDAPRPVLFQLGRAGDPRSLDAERSAAVLEALDGHGRAVLVLAGPQEREVGAALASRLPDRAGRRAHMTDVLDLRTTAALMAAVAERGGVFLGADSGPLHLAGASGLRSVVLAGPQDPERTGPWPPSTGPGSRNQAVAARSSPDCAPCLARRCVHPEGPVCMTGIAIDDVLAALA